MTIIIISCVVHFLSCLKNTKGLLTSSIRRAPFPQPMSSTLVSVTETLFCLFNQLTTLCWHDRENLGNMQFQYLPYRKV